MFSCDRGCAGFLHGKLWVRMNVLVQLLETGQELCDASRDVRSFSGHIFPASPG
jgi:hypothetical protein